MTVKILDDKSRRSNLSLSFFSTGSTTTIGMNMTLYGVFLKMYVIQQIPSLDVIKTRVGQQRMEDFGPHGLVTDCHQLKLVIWLRSLFSLCVYLRDVKFSM